MIPLRGTRNVGTLEARYITAKDRKNADERAREEKTSTESEQRMLLGNRF